MAPSRANRYVWDGPLSRSSTASAPLVPGRRPSRATPYVYGQSPRCDVCERNAPPRAAIKGHSMRPVFPRMYAAGPLHSCGDFHKSHPCRFQREGCRTAFVNPSRRRFQMSLCHLREWGQMLYSEPTLLRVRIHPSGMARFCIALLTPRLAPCQVSRQFLRRVRDLHDPSR